MRDEAPHTDDHGAERDDCGAGPRNRYFRGKTMKADDFDKEQRYFIGRRRLITRSVLGWGVVHGLAVEGSHEAPDYQPPADAYQTDPAADSEQSIRNPENQHDRGSTSEAERKCKDPKPIAVGAGLALDRHGREIGLRGQRTLDIGNTFVIEVYDKDRCRTIPLDKLTPGRYLLSIHYAERAFGDAQLPDACGCDDPQKQYVCETAVFSLRKITTRRCACGEKPCSHTCKCGVASTCGHGSRGPHACLCNRTADAVDDAAPLCEWRGYRIDPQDAVALACVVVEVRQGKCDLEIVGCIEDDCSPRRLVKSNDLLYDLIRGCDLARISWIYWSKWHRSDEQMPWKEFEGYFQENGSTQFIVRFSEPILETTLKRDVITISAVTTEQATGWRVARRIPVIGVDTTPAKGYLKHYPDDLPPGTTNQMRVRVRPEWIRDEIEYGRESWLSERDFRIEIEIYGDYILDCHGQAIDANPVGLRPAPTGNGSPGGTYRSTFRVEHKHRGHRRDDAA